MITDKPNTEHGNGTNTVLPAVAPTLTLSTDGIALDCARDLWGNAIGATKKIDLMDSSREIVARAIAEYKPYAVCKMFSGGDDSMTALHVAKEIGLKVDFIIHG